MLILIISKIYFNLTVFTVPTRAAGSQQKTFHDTGVPTSKHHKHNQLFHVKVKPYVNIVHLMITDLRLCVA